MGPLVHARILLADKLESLRRSLAGALIERGLDVLHASGRSQALARAPQADVILLDRNLTEQDSLDVIRELRSREESRRVPVIVHTPKRDEDFEHRAREAGAEVVLRRPFDYERLFHHIERLSPDRTERNVSSAKGLAGLDEADIVSFLGQVVGGSVPTLRPHYNPDAPLGYAYPCADELLNGWPAGAVELLEDLVAEGLLDRRLEGKVHLCPSCGWHTLNFIEVCPRCGDLDIRVEEVIHHFACAHVGPWSEFKQGVDLICPKCDQRLRHMGLDYEKPSDTYVCRHCGHVFNESPVQGRCFRCEHVTPAEELRPTRVYAYTPNAKTQRAVEYGRLYGLDIQSVLFEDRSRTFRRDYLIFEIEREIYRARRYDTPLSLVLFSVDGLEQCPGVAGDAEVAALRRQIFESVADTLRDLDVVSTLDDGLAAVLLPETPVDAARKVADRIHALVTEFQAANKDEQLTVTAAVAELEEDHEDGAEFFDYAYRALLWAVKNRTGETVTTETWQSETADA